MKSAARIAVMYAIVSALATAANIGCQALVIWLYHGVHAVPLSVLAGTVTGLPIKYLLEKKYIFGFRSKSLAHDGHLFVVYGFFGVFTTAIFWGIEYAFHLVFQDDAMRYLGGAIGLTLGSIIKYQLDKRFVFVSRPTRAIGAA